MSILEEKKNISGKVKELKKEFAIEEFAVIETGGKQYKVASGDFIKIEKIAGDFKDGDKITFDKVLLVDNKKGVSVGTPYLADVKVEGILEKIGRAQKVVVIKYKQKSRYFKKAGHRQNFFKVKIDKIIG